MVRFAFVVAGFACLTATNAWAQVGQEKKSQSASSGPRTNDAKAAALRAEGEEFVKADDCKGAMDPLRSAWALREDAKTAVLLGECELRLGQAPEAAHHLTWARDLLPDGAERTRVASMLQDVSSRVTRLDIVVNEKDAVVIAGRFVVDTPVENLFVEPGDIKITVKKSGFGEQQRQVRAIAGKTERLQFTLTRRSNDSELDHPERSAPRGLMIPAYVGAGAGLAAVGLGIGLLIAGRSQGTDADVLLDKLVGRDPCKADPAPKDCATILILRLDHDRYVNASTGLFVTGGLLLGGAFVYGIVTSRKTQGDVAIIPIVSPTNNGILLQGRF